MLLLMYREIGEVSDIINKLTNHKFYRTYVN